jgi:hypothetical protein
MLLRPCMLKRCQCGWVEASFLRARTMDGIEQRGGTRTRTVDLQPPSSFAGS